LQDVVLFARQPIFDRSLQVFAYELLFRQGAATQADFSDGDMATRSVMLNAYTHSDTFRTLNNKPGLVNVSKTMLNALPDVLREIMYIEVLEDYHSDHDLMPLLAGLRRRGFKLVLDDFEAKDYRPELIELVDMVKIDVLATPPESVAPLLERLRQHNVTLVAEKIEDHAMHQTCLAQGFDYFQGYFFCKPEPISGQQVDPDRMGMLMLLADLYRPDIDIDAIYKHVQRDPVLSFKLLQLVNSAFYRRANSIDSLHQAVMLLGLDRIRSWVTLINMSRLSDKPGELQREALTRAFFCEYLAGQEDMLTAESGFTVGLLSVLDAWLDRPMQRIVEQLPLSDEMKAALIRREGRLGSLLAVAVDYSHSQWDALPQTVLRSDEVRQWQEAYNQSVLRADELLD
jgi:EAL and modified HD-GYP domain-containing signal transduction protein